MRARTVVRTLMLSMALAAPASGAAAAGDASEPTVAELVRRIEALEKELAEIRGHGTACDQSEPPRRAGIVAVPKKQADAAAGEGEAAAEGTASGGSSATHLGRSAEAPPAAQPTGKPVAGYNNGFFVASADGDYKLTVGGYMQADSHWFVDDGTSDDTDEFLIRRARLEIEGKFFDRYGFSLTPDFAGSNLTLQEASLDVEFAPWARLRAGKFKTPFGIERLQSSSDIPFVERALTNNLIPGRDVGVRVSGELADERVKYALGVFNGVPDGTSGDEDVNDSVDVVARVFAKPWSTFMYSPLRGLGFGAAATYGREQGSEDDDQLSSYKTSGGTAFFRYENSGDDAIADGGRYRVSPQASWFEGPFGLLTEYVLSTQQVSREDERGWIANQAWQIRSSVVLTGEHATDEGIEPDRPFDFGGGQWGAWELALRWSSLDVDEEAFTKELADPEESVRHADALAMAVNWYLNRHVKFYLDYERTMFGGGDEDGDRPSEDVFLTRMQVRF